MKTRIMTTTLACLFAFQLAPIHADDQQLQQRLATERKQVQTMMKDDASCKMMCEEMMGNKRSKKMMCEMMANDPEAMKMIEKSKK